MISRSGHNYGSLWSAEKNIGFNLNPILKDAQTDNRKSRQPNPGWHGFIFQENL
jgi:hypothetical protein